MLRWRNFSETQQVPLIVDDRELARTPRRLGQVVAEFDARGAQTLQMPAQQDP